MQNPILINGIDTTPDRPDLLERSIIVELQPIEKTARKTEDQIIAEFNEDHPKLFGAICTSLSAALNEHKINSELPRMADFTNFVIAAESSLHWNEGTFIKALERNQKEMADDCIEACPFISALLEFLDCRYNNEWNGTMTKLLSEIQSHLGQNHTYLGDRLWPKSVNAAGNLLKRFEPYLRQLKYELIKIREFNNQKRQRMIYISKIVSN